MSGDDWRSDYVPVAERIEAFYRKHPEGSLQSELVEYTAERVTVRALAYRTPDDARPAIGHASEPIPGATSFTRGSELENAETSAWGRALAAAGLEVSRGIASAEEVRSREPQPKPEPRTQRVELRELIGRLALERKIGPDELAALARDVGVKGQATIPQLRKIVAILQEEGLPDIPDAPDATEGADDGNGYD